MRFKSQQARMKWLQATAMKIYEMEHDRKICILSGDYDKAFRLLMGIKLARKLFAKESKKYGKPKLQR